MEKLCSRSGLLSLGRVEGRIDEDEHPKEKREKKTFRGFLLKENDVCQMNVSQIVEGGDPVQPMFLCTLLTPAQLTCYYHR